MRTFSAEKLHQKRKDSHKVVPRRINQVAMSVVGDGGDKQMNRQPTAEGDST